MTSKKEKSLFLLNCLRKLKLLMPSQMMNLMKWCRPDWMHGSAH